jgi:hypothetical protein
MNTASHRRQAVIAGRARRIGWPVEVDHTGKEWLYRITRPDGRRVILTKSPSDTHWEAAVLRRLNGREKLFDEAEAAWKAARETARQAALAADKAAGEAAAARAAATVAAVNRAAGPYAVTDADPAWILTPHDLPETRQVIIGPELARKILDTVNTGNRRFRSYRADEFAQVIRDGEWAVTHQGMAIDSTGTLQDGQHRLAAIAATGQAQQILASVGMPPSNFTKLDAPLLRTARDALGMRGEHHVTVLSSASRLIIGWDRHGSELYARKGQTKISIDSIDRFVTEHADHLRAAVTRGQEIRREIKIVSSALTAGIYLIGREIGHDDPRVIRFFDDLETGLRIDKTDPVYLLRRQYITQRADRGRPNQYVALALMIKCWNARAVGRHPQNLVWRSNEWFPSTIITPAPEDDDA